jgi:glutathione S-transferase
VSPKLGSTVAALFVSSWAAAAFEPDGGRLPLCVSSRTPMLRLVCGNLNYSSWSIRPWLALKHAALPFRVHDIGLRTEPGWKERILAFSGAGNVPVLVDGSLSVHESLAICEYVAELAPDAMLWPADSKLRARGRAISCEMHSGFASLRQAMSHNLRARAKHTPHSPAVDADIARILDQEDMRLGFFLDHEAQF